MTRQERSSDILDDIQPKMGLNSQGKNIYLQLHLNFHLTAAAAPRPQQKAVSRQSFNRNANKGVIYLQDFDSNKRKSNESLIFQKSFKTFFFCYPPFFDAQRSG